LPAAPESGSRFTRSCGLSPVSAVTVRSSASADPVTTNGSATFGRIFAAAAAAREGREAPDFEPGALAALKAWPWPGNIRQLENRIKKALVLCDKALIQPEDLDLGPEATSPILPLEKAKEEFQRKYVLEALERNNGNRTQTARDLGVDPRTIFRYLEAERGAVPPGGGDGESGS
jgi:transcriptional regulator with AAA-type ATPase domain